VGPTGVGKTTTIAKLAAHAALLAEKPVAIVTLDSYRIGGAEQIRTYADLIGVPLVLCSDPSQLASTLQELRSKQCVFIDTPGHGPKEHAAFAQLQQAFARSESIEVHLAVSAGSTAESIDAQFARYQPLGVDRLLFTKIDEAADFSELVIAPSRLQCPMTYLTNGQRVPEDLEIATTERLLWLLNHGCGASKEAA